MKRSAPLVFDGVSLITFKGEVVMGGDDFHHYRSPR
jgi:hypothetical protein